MRDFTFTIYSVVIVFLVIFFAWNPGHLEIFEVVIVEVALIVCQLLCMIGHSIEALITETAQEYGKKRDR